MTASDLRPVIGAALSAQTLPPLRNWILDKQRDLEIQDFFRADMLDGDWQGRVAQLKSLLDGYHGRLGIHGPFWGFSVASHDPTIRSVVTRRLLQGLDVCEALNATQMVVHSPFTTWDDNNLDMLPGGYDSVVERTHATMTEVVKRAENIGVELVIENIEDKDPALRGALARSFNSEAVKVSIDTGHANYACHSTGAPPVDYYVNAAGDQLAHVHIQDTDGYADRHWPPGHGNICWRAVFASLGRLSVKPRLIIEIRDQTKVLEGFAHLEALGLVD
jgi:sugar phosphate isomerase/epimerase